MKTAAGIMSNGIGFGARLRGKAAAQAVGVTLAAAVVVSLPSLGLHAPNWALLAAQSPVVQAHAAAATAALLVGGGLMVGVKGRTMHRRFGWLCAALVFATAFSSLFIRQSNHGGFSLIHGLSAWTLLMLPIALRAARRHDVKRHRRTMSGLFYGGLVIAGLFTFVPGRVMHAVFFG